MPGAALEIEELSVRGARGRRLLDVPRFALPAGTALAVRGPSGAGKSTFLHALAGLVPAAAGAVRWDGEDIAALPEPARAAFRRRRVGFVFQEHLLFEELSAPENAAIAALYGPRAGRDAVHGRGRERLAELGLDAGETRRSDTYSGGERQRIAVARALATDPAILLADEPTASLDRANADRLAAELVRLAHEEGRTLVAVSHDPALHAVADRVIDLADGRIDGCIEGRITGDAT